MSIIMNQKSEWVLFRFSIFMWFVSTILLLVGILLLRGSYSSMCGKIFNNTTDKEGYAKASGKPALFMAIGLAVSGAVAVTTSKITGLIFIMVSVVIIVGIWFANIQRRFS